MENVTKLANAGKVVTAANLPSATIKFYLDGEAHSAVKIRPEEYSEYHHRILQEVKMVNGGALHFSEPGWQSVWIGAGEEKSVYLVIDSLNRAFALEVLGKDGYRHGELIGGHYFDDLHISGVCGKPWNSEAIFGHVFSGRVRAREFIYGETLAGPPRLDADCEDHPHTKHYKIGHAVSAISRTIAHSMVTPRYWKVKRIFHDAHEANVMIEFVPLHNPEKKPHYLFPLPFLEADGRISWFFIHFVAIDVRTGK